MASTWDCALLLLFVLLLPLRLLSLLRRTPGGGRPSVLPSALLLVSVPILLSVIFAVSDPKASNSADSQLEEMKMKVARLESKLEETTQALSSQTLYLEDKRKLVEEMERKTEFLQNELSKTTASLSSPSQSKKLVDALVEQVGLLWEASRKNNFIIHILESKAHDMKDSLKAVTSELEKMESVVTEQWIQIRQLEQSLHLTKTMTSRVHTRRRQSTKSTLVKFIQSIRQYCLPEFIEFSDSFFLGDATSCSWISRVFEQFKFYTSAVKECHHENRAINHQDDMRGTVGRIPLKDIDECYTWLTGMMDVSEWTDDESVCPYDSSTLAEFFRSGNDDGGSEENDGDYMSDNDISSSDDDDVFFDDDDAEAAEENDDCKFDDDICSDDDDGDYVTDGDYFSSDDETEGDNYDDYKLNDVAYGLFSEEDTDDDVFSDDDGDWIYEDTD